MNPLVTNQRVFSWFCVCPVDENTGILWRILYVLNILISIVIELSDFIASFKFIIENFTTNLEASLYAVTQVAGSSGLLYMIASAIVLRKKITALFYSLSKIFDESK